jgi:plasmid stabilization system protein ParE
MKIRLSRRVEAELASHFEFGVARFGVARAERTFQRIRHALFSTLPSQPMIGKYLADRNVFKYVITGTPFVAYYRIDAQAEELTVVAIFYGTQDRTEFADWEEASPEIGQDH